MRFLETGEIPRISFRYGEKSSNDFLQKWQTKTTTETNPGGELTRRTWKDPETGLKVTLHIQKLEGFPALDWMAEIENGGKADSPIIEDLLAMDISVPMPPQERLRLHHANGSLCKMDDFLPQMTELTPGDQKSLAPRGGRSSDTAFPFMNLQRKDCGLVLAVGWTGQWTAKFERDDKSLRIAAGMERTHLSLHPGERIRTPRILILSWEGNDAEAGNNLLRQVLLKHYLPRINGELVMPPTAQCLQFYYYLTGKASEEFEMKALPKVAATGSEVYWIDALWYGDKAEWWDAVGSWVVNKERFPHGIRPISDAARKAGMKFLLWFEPERARKGSLLDREHPEFLLANEQDTANLLFNLGMPEARKYITDLVSNAIAEHGVDVYRQDFNFSPLPYWQAADAPDRIGMTEIRHIEGLYAFWDELRRRHPGLWIDNCASGGRRIDLETMSRSLPLWPSDFPDICGLPTGEGLSVGDQCINTGLARWVPLFGGGVWNFTPYGTRGEIMGGFTFGAHIARADFPKDDCATIPSFKDSLSKGKTLMDDDFPMADAQAAIREWKSVRPFFLGDFHLLLPLTISYHDWCAWQLHRADMNAGVAMLFRRHQSPFHEMEVELKDIVPDAEYEVSLSARYEEAPRKRMTGKQLMQLSIAIPEKPGSVLVRYTRIP